MVVRGFVGCGSREAAVAMGKGPPTWRGIFDVFAFGTVPFPTFNPLLWTDLELHFTQDLGPEPTKKIAALHHQPPLHALKTSSVLIPRLSLRVHPLRP